MKYVVYDGDGNIVCFGESTEPDDHGLGTILEADATNLSHYVANGALVAYTEGQTAIKAAYPSFPAKWSNTSMSWVDTRELATARDDQWELVKASRDAVINGGVTWSGSVFDSDPIAQGRVAGAATLALMAVVAGHPEAFSKTWKLADNSTRVLSANDMMAVGVALGQMVQDAIDQGETLRLQIYASTSLDQIKEFTWPTSSMS